MAIRVTLDRVLLDRRMSLTELSERVGVTLANLSILKTGKAKAVRFSTLDALCRELDCQPARQPSLNFTTSPPTVATGSSQFTPRPIQVNAVAGARAGIRRGGKRQRQD